MASLRVALVAFVPVAIAVSGCAFVASESGVPAETEMTPNPRMVPSEGAVVPELGTKAPYPAGPYGLKVGDTIEDLSWEGLRRGIQAFPVEGDAPKWETIALHDYYDPTGEGGIRAIKIDVECVW